MKGKNNFGVQHLSGLPVTVMYALIIAAALLGLVLLRHFSLRVEA